MLLFLLGTFIVSLWWGWRARAPRAWVLVVVSFVVGVAYLSRRAI
ncbi:MAG: hypothetical protein ABW195_10890 [Ilumatobacteraceae bacterium]